MGNAELQELVKAYAEGKVTFSDYRQQRSELLDTITGNIRVKDDRTDEKSDKNPDKEKDDVAVEKDLDDKEEIISLTNNRSPVAFLLIVTIVLLSFVYLLTII